MDSVFKDITDEQFEQILKNSGFKYTKVNKGNGGILYKGVLYKDISEFDKELIMRKMEG